MKLMKTTLGAFLVLGLACAFNASADLTLTCANQSGAVGATKTMTVNLVYDGAKTLIGGDLVLQYDPAVFTTVANFALGAAATGKLQFAQAAFADAANSEIVVNLDDNFAQLPGITSANGVLLTFDVTVAADAPAGVKDFTWRTTLGPNGYKTNFQADTEVAITTLTSSQFTVLRYFNAMPDVAPCNEDATNVQIDVTANDVDETNTHPTSGITLNSVSSPSAQGGTVTVSNGKAVYTPAANFFGTDTFTYTATHARTAAPAGNYQATGTVTVTVTAVNDTPSFTKGADQAVNEDAGAQTVTAWATNISAGPANEAAQVVDFIVSNNNNPLFSAQPAIAADGTLTYTPTADANGVATVTVQIHDNGGDGALATSTAQTFTITVNAVNDLPSFTKGADQTVNEDAGQQTVANWATGISVGPANESTQAPAFVITGNTNPGIFSVTPAISPTGTLTYTPCTTSAACGTSTVSVKVTDNGGTDLGGVNESAVQTFTVTVNPVNDLPVVSTAITNSSALVNGGDITATVTASDEETALGQLTYAYVWKRNGATLKTVIATAGATTNTFTQEEQDYANGENYAVTCEVTVADTDAGSTPSTAQTYVGNQPPAITASTATPTTPAGTAVSDTLAETALTINEGQGVDFSVTFSDFGNSPTDDGIKSFTWEKKTDADAGFTAIGTTTTLNQPYTSPQTSSSSISTNFFTSRVDHNTVITVRVTCADGMNVTGTKTWNVTVTDVNQVPVFTQGGPVTVLEDSGAYAQGWATSILAGANEDVTNQTLAFEVTLLSGVADLFSVAPAIAANGTLTFTTAQDKNGSATYNVVLKDNAAANNASDARQVTITVTPVNDAPSFTAGSSLELNEDAFDDGETRQGPSQAQTVVDGGQTVAGWATNIVAGPANENAQSVLFLVSNDNNELFATQPAISPAGALTYKLAHHTYGQATVTVTLQDNDGTANAGDDTSDPAQFTISVNPINDIPTVPAYTSGFTKFQAQTAAPITIAATDPEVGDAQQNDSILFQFATPVPPESTVGEPAWQTLSIANNTEGTALTFTSTVQGKQYTRKLIYSANTDGSITFNYKAISDFRGSDKLLVRGVDAHGAASDPGNLTVTVGTPLWYPFFDWATLMEPDISGTTREEPPTQEEWFRVQIWDGQPDAGALVLDTNLLTAEASMMPTSYFLAGSLGLTPLQDGAMKTDDTYDYTTKDYFYRVAKWTPETDEYSDWLVDHEEEAVHTVTTQAYPYATIDPSTGAAPSVAPTANTRNGNTADYTLTFTPLTAQGYEIEITCAATNYRNVISHIYRPAADGSIILDTQEHVDVTLPASTVDLTYSWRVRGFNPINTADNVMNWFKGPDITVAANATTATDIAQEQPFILAPVNGEVITAPTGTVNVILQWTSVPGATSYVAYLGPAVGDLLYNNTNIGNVLTHALPLQPGLYSFQIIAVDAAGKYSKWSQLVTFHVVENLAAPLVTKVTTVGGDGTATLTFHLQNGSSKPTAITMYFLDLGLLLGGADDPWVSYPWTGAFPGNSQLTFTGASFSAGQYLFLQAEAGDAASDFSLFEIQAP